MLIGILQNYFCPKINLPVLLPILCIITNCSTTVVQTLFKIFSPSSFIERANVIYRNNVELKGIQRGLTAALKFPLKRLRSYREVEKI